MKINPLFPKSAHTKTQRLEYLLIELPGKIVFTVGLGLCGLFVAIALLNMFEGTIHGSFSLQQILYVALFTTAFAFLMTFSANPFSYIALMLTFLTSLFLGLTRQQKPKAFGVSTILGLTLSILSIQSCEFINRLCVASSSGLFELKFIAWFLFLIMAPLYPAASIAGGSIAQSVWEFSLLESRTTSLNKLSWLTQLLLKAKNPAFSVVTAMLITALVLCFSFVLFLAIHIYTR